MKKQMHLAESVINRLMNFADELDEMDAITAAVAIQGDQIDAALGAPTPPAAPADPTQGAMLQTGFIGKALNLDPLK